MRERVLVTGSSRGIGLSIAKDLAEQGFRVSLHGREPSENLEKARRDIQALDMEPEILTFDVSDRKRAKEILDASVESHGAFFGVILNAGMTQDGVFPAVDGEAWDTVIGTNLDSFYNVLHPIIMPMIRLRRGGRIIVITSLSGIVGQRGQVSYSASKAGLIGAAKSLSKELATRNISVNCIAPGLIETDMLKGMDLEEVLPMIPMRRLGKPEEVSALASFLMTPLASYITGQVISVNGGWV